MLLLTGRRRVACGRQSMLWCAIAGIAVFSMAGATSVPAQDKPDPPVAGAVQPPAAPPAIKFRERPRYVTDTQRLRRTVQIDGVLSDG